jgi:YVTN family beta-propeller protein
MYKNLISPRAFLLSLCYIGSIFLSSCQDDNQSGQVIDPKGAYEKGVLVVNEGNFQKGNGAISFINKVSKTVEKDVFLRENNRPLGDVVQSITVHNDRAYIVVNNSNKIEIADANTFKSLGVVNNLKLPRYMVAIGNKGYVTEWVSFSGNGQVTVLDLTTNAVLKTIPVGVLPEKMAMVNNKIYLINSGENTVSVINLASDAVETTLTVSDSPNSLAIDANNKLWLLCGGQKNYNPDFTINETTSTPGNLVRLNPANNTLEATLAFTSKTLSPEDLVINGTKNKLYYRYNGKVYQHDITATTLPATAFLNRNFYGLGVDPADNLLYGADAGSFTASGKVVRFNPSGAALDSFTVNIGPSEFLFR